MKLRLSLAMVGALLAALWLSPGAQIDAQSSTPTVSAVSGSPVHGQSLTITGSGFGTKATAAPLKYDDFQNLSDGDVVSANGWGVQGDFPPVASSLRLRPGTPFTRNMRSHWTPAGTAAASNIHLRNQRFVKFYVDGWMYFDASQQTSPTQNIKPLRLHQAGAGAPNVYLNIYAPGAGAVGCGRDGVTRSDSDWASASSSDFYNRWVHVQWLVDAGAGNNTATGTCQLYLNGALVYDHRNVPTIGAGFYNWPEIYIGNYIRSGDWSGHTYAHWESVYVDNSWARVEIGDNRDYRSARHREIQTPTSWSNSSVTVNVNRGSFTPGSAMYLFVIDSSGNVSAGFPLGGSATSPSAPRNLRITSGS